MDYFQYKDDRLFVEDVPLSKIAGQFSTPCFIYSRAALERQWHAFNDALADYPHQICYAVKANSNLAVLNLLARLGSGFDILSAGELARVIAAGGDPKKTVFSGVCKQRWEIKMALETGIKGFNIESEGELKVVSEIARELDTKCNISVRINPDVDAKTHPYISTGLRSNKFGLPAEQALKVYEEARDDEYINIYGVACHIGSQLTELKPYEEALGLVLMFVDELRTRSIFIENIDFGGGLGVRYHRERPPSPDEYCSILLGKLKARNDNLSLTIEPGRAIVGNAGVFLTQVHYLKSSETTDFCIVDGGMNDLIRPSLYQAYQEIIEVDKTQHIPVKTYDIVGPVCESSDFLGKDRALSVQIGSLLAMRTSGAYCAVMSSNYNTRARAPEILVDGDQYQCVREREQLDMLFEGETVLSW